MFRNEVLTECPIGMDPYLCGNKYGSVSIGHAVELKAEHDTVKVVLQMHFICCTQFFLKLNHLTAKFLSMSCWQVATYWDWDAI